VSRLLPLWLSARLTHCTSIQCVYFGDVGEDASVLNAYLEKNGAPVPADAYVPPLAPFFAAPC
jgi:hypothetical protein